MSIDIPDNLPVVPFIAVKEQLAALEFMEKGICNANPLR